VLRYLSTDPSVRRQLSAIPSAEIGFNYLGQFDDLFAAGFFSPASEPAGPLQDPGSLRPHVLEISARVVGGRLHVAWNYSANLHDESTVERLAGRFLERVRDVVAHCGSGDAGAYTPSDFPEAKVSQDQLDRLMTKLKAGGKR
jgi:non-ribosomal peptide synthase protein (TIGR01720 family)